MSERLPGINVVADDRERESGVIDALRRMPRIIVTKRRLPLGDYLVDGRLLFERKALADLVASIIDGRLLAQGVRLAACRYRAVLVLEGTSAALSGSQMRREAIQGALVALTVGMGIPILRAMTAEETARLMLFTADQARRSTLGGHARPGSRPNSKRAVQLRVLQGVPMIGPTRAARLLDTFGNIESIVQASRRELSAVPGIGDSTAAAIRWTVSEPGP